MLSHEYDFLPARNAPALELTSETQTRRSRLGCSYRLRSVQRNMRTMRAPDPLHP